MNYRDAADLDQLLLSLRLLLRLLLTVVVGHGDDGEDEVDEVERAEEDDENEKEHVIQAVRSDNLTPAVHKRTRRQYYYRHVLLSYDQLRAASLIGRNAVT